MSLRRGVIVRIDILSKTGTIKDENDQEIQFFLKDINFSAALGMDVEFEIELGENGLFAVF